MPESQPKRRFCGTAATAEPQSLQAQMQPSSRPCLRLQPGRSRRCLWSGAPAQSWPRLLETPAQWRATCTACWPARHSWTRCQSQASLPGRSKRSACLPALWAERCLEQRLPPSWMSLEGDHMLRTEGQYCRPYLNLESAIAKASGHGSDAVQRGLAVPPRELRRSHSD